MTDHDPEAAADDTTPIDRRVLALRVRESVELAEDFPEGMTPEECLAVLMEIVEPGGSGDQSHGR